MSKVLFLFSFFFLLGVPQFFSFLFSELSFFFFSCSISLVPSPELAAFEIDSYVFGCFLGRVDPDSKSCHERHALASGTK